jgi:hypothetical protein
MLTGVKRKLEPIKSASKKYLIKSCRKSQDSILFLVDNRSFKKTEKESEIPFFVKRIERKGTRKKKDWKKGMPTAILILCWLLLSNIKFQ